VGSISEPVSNTKLISPQSLVAQYGNKHVGFYYSYDLEAANRDIAFFYPNRILE
jgi:hypothetical protein